MLLILLLCATATILAVDVPAVATSAKVRRAAATEADNTLVGAGYSGDSEQLTPQKCYNAAVSSVSGQQAYMQLGTALSFSEMESKLGISATARGGYGMFAADAQADYMRSLQDTDYSLSLNYYYYVTVEVNVQIRGSGDAALSESGKTFYNDGKNPYFGLLCGDFYIGSYQQGALLTMGFNIKFSNAQAKSEFTAKAGASYGNIVSAAGSINSLANKHKLTGSVSIQAYQKGGEPSQLSNLLTKDSSDTYHALRCSITAMDDCIKAASGLLDYAKTNFPNQVSSEKNKGLTPLGIRFSSFRPIEHIGLTRPTSLVTKEVEQYRDELSSRLKEAKYYQQKLYTYFNDEFPVKLSDGLINKAKSLRAKVNNNVDILMHPTSGAVGCFNTPDRCKTIKDKIDSLLHKITVSDLEFLDGIKYKISMFDNDSKFIGVFHTGNTGVVWSNVTIPDPTCGGICDIHITATEFNITDTSCTFNLVYDINSMLFKTITTKLYNCNSNDGGREYNCEPPYSPVAHIYLGHRPAKDHIKLIKKLSPFFFEAFAVHSNNGNR